MASRKNSSKQSSLNASTDGMTPETVNMLTEATPAQTAKIQALAQVFNEGHTLDNSTVQDLVQRVEKKVSTQPKNERQQKLAKKTKTVDNTLIAEQPGGNSPILNPQPEVEKATKPAKPTKPDFAFIDVPATIERNGQMKYTTTMLGSLLALDKTPVVDAKVGLRELKREHVEHLSLAYQNGADIPPVKVAFSTWGPVLLGGYHRQAAMRDTIQMTMFGDLSPMTEDEKKAFSERVAQFPIIVEIVPGMTMGQAVDFAYRDNLDSGLPIADKNRSRYAIYLIARAEEQGIKLSLEKAGAMAGVSRIAVFRQMQRDKGIVPKSRKDKMPADLLTDADDKLDLEQYFQAVDSQAPVDRLNKATKTLISAMLAVYDEVQDIDQLSKYFSEIAENVSVDAATFNAAIECVAGALSFVQLSEEEVPVK